MVIQSLIEELDSSITAINDGKQIACGAPDFRLLRKGLLAGMIEAKDINADLSEEQKSDQLKRSSSFSDRTSSLQRPGMTDLIIRACCIAFWRWE